MRVLVASSWITVVCALLISAWTVPQYVATGRVNVTSTPWFEVMYVFPGLVAVPTSIFAAVVAAALIRRRGLTTLAHSTLAWGQILTVVLIAISAIMPVLPATAGCESLLMPLALQVGQVVVAIGLILLLRPARG